MLVDQQLVWPIPPNYLLIPVFILVHLWCSPRARSPSSSNAFYEARKLDPILFPHGSRPWILPIIQQFQPFSYLTQLLCSSQQGHSLHILCIPKSLLCPGRHQSEGFQLKGALSLQPFHSLCVSFTFVANVNCFPLQSAPRPWGYSSTSLVGSWITSAARDHPRPRGGFEVGREHWWV